jgi:hypothetical protein
MPQEVSISYQAVKSKVYRLIDALVEGSKTESEVQESMRRWWKLIHPADRPVAQKYLLAVLARSHASLETHPESPPRRQQTWQISLTVFTRKWGRSVN